jgi:hypothetical protein
MAYYGGSLELFVNGGVVELFVNDGAVGLFFIYIEINNISRIN